MKKGLVLLVFVCSFVSFLLGWFCALFVVPGKNPAPLSQTPVFQTPVSQNKDVPESQDLEAPTLEQDFEKTKTRENSDQALMEQIKENMLFLFDPYRGDPASKKPTLEGDIGVLQGPRRIELKKRAPPKNLVESSNSALVKNPKPPEPSVKIKKDIKQELLSLMEEEARSSKTSGPLSPQLKKIQEDFLKRNREHLLAIESQQKFFKSEGKYSFLVNVFSTHEESLEYFKQMKDRYPLWSFLLKAYADHVRVYLGPFPSRELALEFKKQFLQSPASQNSSLDYLEEVSL